MTFRIRKKRSNIERQARDAAYMQLVANPTDLAIGKYLSGNLGVDKPNYEDLVAVRYVIGLVENSREQMKSSKFNEVMTAWTEDDDEEYSNLTAELESDLIESHGGGKIK